MSRTAKGGGRPKPKQAKYSRPERPASNRLVIRIIAIAAAVVVIAAIAYSAANGVLFATNGH